VLLLGLSVSLTFGCTGSGGAMGSGGSRDGGQGSDASDGGIETSDSGSSDTATPPLCSSPTDRGAATASTHCGMSPLAVDAATICAGATTCPITKAYALHCQSFGYGPWLVPTGPDGASVLYGTSGTGTQMFTIGPGTSARVDDLPTLSTVIHSLSVDHSGTRTIFTGELPAVGRFRETATCWSSELASTVVGNDLALVSAGRAVDETHAFIAYHDLGDNLPRLATRDGTCWRSTLLARTPMVSMTMDTDAMDRPWVAWIRGLTGETGLFLAGPDGAIYAPWKTNMNQVLSFWDRPLVLAGGLDGTSAFPALATQRSDGLHVITPDLGTAVWTDRIVPGSNPVVYSGNCPPQGGASTGPPCQGLTTCAEHGVGALSGYGLVRTDSGRAYAAWLEVESDTNYNLTTITQFCTPGGPMLCTCSASPTSTTRTLTMVVARVSNAATPSQAVRRFHLDAAATPTYSLPSDLALVLAARGNTLLAVATLTVMPESQMRYFEIDSSQLP